MKRSKAATVRYLKYRQTLMEIQVIVGGLVNPDLAVIY